MSIPANILSELSNLQAQTAAATPLTSASQQTVVAIQLNAEQLLTDVGTALTAAVGALDTWTAPVDPVAIINGILGLEISSMDQSALALMQGYIGRNVINLDQLSP